MKTALVGVIANTIAALAVALLTAASVQAAGEENLSEEGQQVRSEFADRNARLLTLLGEGTAADTASAPTMISTVSKPAVSKALDSAIDFNNNEGTLALTVAPALLVDPWAPYGWAGIKLTVSSNTEAKNITFGGKWEWSQKDPRVFFNSKRLKEVDRDLETAMETCNETMDTKIAAAQSDGDDALVDELITQKAGCLNKNALTLTVDRYMEEAAKAKFGFSVAGNATYNNDGAYDGAKATLAGEWDIRLGDRDALPLTVNANFEDARPSDGQPTDPRDKSVGGSVQLEYQHTFIPKRGDPKKLGVGFAFQGLACVDDTCDNGDSTIRLNPFISVGLTKSIAGRVDLVWEGEGSDFRNAIGALKLDYSFSGI